MRRKLSTDHCIVVAEILDQHFRGKSASMLVFVGFLFVIIVGFHIVLCHPVSVAINRDAALEKSKFLDLLQKVISDLEARGFVPGAYQRPPPKRETPKGGCGRNPRPYFGD